MGFLDTFLPVIPGLLKHGYPLSAYPPRSIGCLRLASFAVYSISLLTFLVTSYIFNPIDLFGDTLLQSPSTLEIRPNFGPGCTALSVPTDAHFGDFMPFPSLKVQATQFDPSATPLFFENGTSVEGAIVQAGDTLVAVGPVFNQTTVVEFNLAVDLNPGVIELTGDPEQCISLFREQIDAWFTGCGQQPINDTFACEATTPLGSISMSHSIETGYALLPFVPNEAAYSADIGAYFCANSTNLASGGTLLAAVTGPYSCVVVFHRSVLEVLALAFSNATLVYAFALTLFYKLGDGATEPDPSTKMV